MKKYIYQIQMKAPSDGRLQHLFRSGPWLTLGGFSDTRLMYAEGYIRATREHGPCPGLRIIRLDFPSLTLSKVMQESPEVDWISVGMMPQAFGFQWPYYLSAIEKALRTAYADIKHDDVGKEHAEAIAKMYLQLNEINEKVRNAHE